MLVAVYLPTLGFSKSAVETRKSKTRNAGGSMLGVVVIFFSMNFMFDQPCMRIISTEKYVRTACGWL